MYQLVHSILNSDWGCYHLSLLQTKPHSSSSHSAMDMVNLQIHSTQSSTAIMLL